MKDMLDYKSLSPLPQSYGRLFLLDMWQWQINQWGKGSLFQTSDYFGIQGKNLSDLGAILNQAHVITNARTGLASPVTIILICCLLIW